MSSTVADQLLERLSQWGVKRVFGYPGDGINGIMGAMGRRAEAFDYIRVRHEEMAAFMAGAHAKFTGEVGVCLATSGPGAIHLLNGLYDARMDHQPVLAIVGQQAATALGSDYQQEVDLQSLFKDVSAYVETVVSPAQLLHVLDRALRVAVGERQVATVIVPNDVQQMAAPKRQPHEHGHVMSAVGFVQPRPYARDAPAVRDRLHRPARHPRQQHADGALRHPADRRQHFPLQRVPTQGRPGAGGADRPVSAQHRYPLSDRSGLARRCRGNPGAPAAAARAEKARRLAPPGRAGGDGQSRGSPAPGRRARRPDQPAAGIPFLVGATAGRCDSLRRQRLAYQLVRPRHPHAPGHARLAVGQAGDHGQRRALRHRRQARLSAAAGGGDGRRRRHADERQRRTGHRAAVLAALGLADLHRAGAEPLRNWSASSRWW